MGSVLGSSIFFGLRDDRDLVYLGSLVIIIVAELIAYVPDLKGGIRMIRIRFIRQLLTGLAKVLRIIALILFFVGTYLFYATNYYP